MKRRDEAERFFQFVNKTETCWLWTGSTAGGEFPGRYGKFRIGYSTDCNRKIQSAHKWSYVHHFGIVPNGLNVNHKCGNNLCVNPEHLYVGTQKENMADAFSHGTRQRGEKNGHAKLSASDVIAARKLRNSGYCYKDIAKIINPNVALGTFLNACKRNTWRWLNDTDEPVRCGEKKVEELAVVVEEKEEEINASRHEGKEGSSVGGGEREDAAETAEDFAGRAFSPVHNS